MLNENYLYNAKNPNEIPFVKMEGLGNDYVYINDLNEALPHLAELAIEVSERHFGIGSDGLIVIRPSKKADFMMRMFNLDGSEGRMCGNGIRCFAKLVHDLGLTTKSIISIETLSGIKTIRLLIDELTEEVSGATVAMGVPILENKEIPIVSAEHTWLSQRIEIESTPYVVTGVSMGNPHIVTYVDNLEIIDLPKIGALFERHAYFPEQVNTEFVELVSPTEINMRVWERGSGETLACGTGACAAVVANILNKLTESKVKVNLLGGQLDIYWDQEGTGQVYMTGPARISFAGRFFRQH